MWDSARLLRALRTRLNSTVSTEKKKKKKITRNYIFKYRKIRNNDPSTLVETKMFRLSVLEICPFNSTNRGVRFDECVTVDERFNFRK